MNVIPWDGKPISAPGCYSNLPIAKYHGGEACDGPSISSSGLRTIFTESPAHYWLTSPLNKHRKPEEIGAALKLGSAAHHLALGEQNFSRFFVLRPETYPDDPSKAWSSNSTSCKRWLADQRRIVLTPAAFERVKGMCGVLEWQGPHIDSGLAMNPLVKAGILDGLIEHSFVWRDEKTGVWLRSRPDAVPTGDRNMADLKTTASVEYGDLERRLYEGRYDMQAALCRMGMRAVWGEELRSYALVWVQNDEPYATAVTEIRPQDMDEAEKDVRIAIDTFARCLERNRWDGPAGSQADAVFIGLSPWQSQRRIERRAYLEKELA